MKICNKKYPEENESIFGEYFKIFDYPLSDFQKYSIEAIVTGNHALICVPTGNGKTLPAEFAIQYFSGLIGPGQGSKKKVIYTSPIKALSNQKYYDFMNKYPNISFGLLTGDIKINPEADVLIMTAEILQNALYNSKTDANTSLSFDMDFNTELACVVHDEVHSINMDDRGHVWESIFMLLPAHVQNVMLSATLDMPEKFAMWCENVGNKNGSNNNGSNNNGSNKEVYLTTLTERVVPLIHSSFIICNQNGIKSIGKDESMKSVMNSLFGKPVPLFSKQDGGFNDLNYQKVKKMVTLMDQKNIHISRAHVLNQVCKYMVENNMLPCACFILSRKQLEIAAREITVPLLEDDSKVGYTIRRECEQLLRKKLPNYQEYLELPEYVSMIALLEKGIATHHSGTIPILKEIVEMMFSLGYIKLLFCTETFACGLNMPIKTVLFTDITKFDGRTSRLLYGYEYTQMAGRAGRRGKDTIGYAIHLNNLFKGDMCEMSEYKKMLEGAPQKLVSKFKISYNLVLNLISNGTDFNTFCDGTMIRRDICNEVGEMDRQIDVLESHITAINISSSMSTPVGEVERYISCMDLRVSAVNKRRKELDKEIAALRDMYKMIDVDKVVMIKYNTLNKDLDKLRNQRHVCDQYLSNSVGDIVELLRGRGFVDGGALTQVGKIAMCFKEVPGLVFAEMMETMNLLSPVQLIMLFSCFTNVTVPDEMVGGLTGDTVLCGIIEDMVRRQNYYLDFELNCGANTGQSYLIQYDLIDAVNQWTLASDIMACKIILQNLEFEKGIYLGEFVKAILKINNISKEMECVSEMIGNVELLAKLKQVPEMTLKFIATNQSLYV